MTEAEYITAANLARVRDAQLIVGQMLPDYGVSKEELRKLTEEMERIGDQIAQAVWKKKGKPHSPVPANHIAPTDG